MRRVVPFALALLTLLVMAPRVSAEGTPRVADERIVLHTIAGDIVLALYPDVAPRHVAQILALARQGIYDGSHFYRMDPRFVAQISEIEDRRPPLTAGQLAAVHKLPLETSDLKHRAGLLSMARFDDPNSARTSFSIVLGDAPHLDGKYTIFGHVESGMDVIGKMLEVQASPPHYAPLVRLSVHRAEVVLAAELANMKLAGPRTVPVSEMDKALVAVREPQARPVIVYGLLLMFAIGVAQVFVAPRLSARRLLSISMINVLICAFLLLITISPLAIYQSVEADSERWVGLFLFAGILAVLKLMGRFETPD